VSSARIVNKMSSESDIKVAYLCADPGIPVDGSKGAAVHFRELGRALVNEKVAITAMVAKRRSESGPLPFAVNVIKTSASSVIRRELMGLADLPRWLEALDGLGRIDAIYERLSLFGIAGSVAARERGIPHFVEVNAPLLQEQARFRTLDLGHLAEGGVREVLAHANTVLAVSAEVRDHVLAHGGDPARTVVFPNAADPSLFANALPARRPAAFTGLVLAFVGSLKPWHGIPFLLRAFQYLRSTRKDLHLWVVGEGPLLDEVRRAAELDPEGIVAAGAVPHAEVVSILKASDVVVCPYTRESPTYFSPLKLLEGMAAGKAILAADVPPIRSFVRHGISAWLFAPDNEDAFEQGVVALSASSALRARLGAVARESCLDSHTWQARARELLRMLSAARQPVVVEARP
jgi:glycosyltransferase involved in cell wall biosynthesis